MYTALYIYRGGCWESYIFAIYLLDKENEGVGGEREGKRRQVILSQFFSSLLTIGDSFAKNLKLLAQK
jgi:hypothetical protein